jgi:hypothetical protein
MNKSLHLHAFCISFKESLKSRPPVGKPTSGAKYGNGVKLKSKDRSDENQWKR